MPRTLQFKNDYFGNWVDLWISYDARTLPEFVAEFSENKEVMEQYKNAYRVRII